MKEMTVNEKMLELKKEREKRPWRHNKEHRESLEDFINYVNDPSRKICKVSPYPVCVARVTFQEFRTFPIGLDNIESSQCSSCNTRIFWIEGKTLFWYGSNKNGKKFDSWHEFEFRTECEEFWRTIR